MKCYRRLSTDPTRKRKVHLTTIQTFHQMHLSPFLASQSSSTSCTSPMQARPNCPRQTQTQWLPKVVPPYYPCGHHTCKGAMDRVLEQVSGALPDRAATRGPRSWQVHCKQRMLSEQDPLIRQLFDISFFKIIPRHLYTCIYIYIYIYI